MFTVGMPVVRRMVALAKAEKLTSAADFLAARYGKNPIVAGFVAIISLAAAIPYIALQLKAVSDSVAVMVRAETGFLPGEAFSGLDLPFVVTLALSGFAIIFGTPPYGCDGTSGRTYSGHCHGVGGQAAGLRVSRSFRSVRAV